MYTTETNLSINGDVVIFQRNGDIDTVLQEKHNKFQSDGIAAIVRALAYGNPLSYIAMLYSSASSPSPIGASGGTLTWNNFVTRGSDSGNGLILCPAYMLEEVEGESNYASFVGLSDSGELYVGNALATGNKVFALGLVQHSTQGSLSSHVLYAAADITPISKAANSQIGVRWKTTITVS